MESLILIEKVIFHHHHYFIIILNNPTLITITATTIFINNELHYLYLREKIPDHIQT